MMAKMRRA